MSLGDSFRIAADANTSVTGQAMNYTGSAQATADDASAEVTGQTLTSNSWNRQWVLQTL